MPGQRIVIRPPCRYLYEALSVGIRSILYHVRPYFSESIKFPHLLYVILLVRNNAGRGRTPSFQTTSTVCKHSKPCPFYKNKKLLMIHRPALPQSLSLELVYLSFWPVILACLISSVALQDLHCVLVIVQD